MASKQQPPRQSEFSSSASSKSTIRSLIYANVYFDGEPKHLLRGLRSNYKGVEDLVPLYLRDSNGHTIRAIRIDVKSDDLAKQFIDGSNVLLDKKEYHIESSIRSLIVSKIATGENEAKLLQDLAHNYIGAEKISRFYDIHKNPVGDIRIDFKSDSIVTKILKDKYIIIDGKRCPVQPYRSFVYTSSQNQNGNDHPSEQPQTSRTEQPQTSQTEQPQTSRTEQLQKSWTKQPQKYLTEQRVKELFREQQMQLEAMINEFENKWNARLSSSAAASTNTNVDQLSPIVKDLSMVCQQFNQQNAQIQRQLGSVVNRVQDAQTKLSDEAWPQLSMQNGH